MTKDPSRRFVSLGEIYSDNVKRALSDPASTPEEVQDLRDQCARRCAGYVSGHNKTIPGWAQDQAIAYANLYEDCCTWLSDRYQSLS